MGPQSLDNANGNSSRQAFGFYNSSRCLRKYQIRQQQWLGLELDAGRGGCLRNQGPGHARRVMRNADTALAVEQNNPAMSAEPRLQVIESALRGLLGSQPLLHVVRSPLAQD